MNPVKYVGFTLIFLIVTRDMCGQSFCGTKSPGKAWENWFSSKVKEYKRQASAKTSSITYTIPVIVHIIHNGDPVGDDENISWAQVKSQIDILNADFAGTNGDISFVPPLFQNDKAGDVGIRFCLALRDTNGNILQEPGVDRIDWRQKGWLNPAQIFPVDTFVSYVDAFIKPQSIWNPKQYLNIWLTQQHWSFFPDYVNYSTFPSGAGLTGISDSDSYVDANGTSGIVMYHKRWGDTGTVLDPLNIRHKLGRIATHEVGHYLGVLHTFEHGNTPSSCPGNNSNNCHLEGDYCCDTPPDLDSSQGCPSLTPSCSPFNYPWVMTMNYMTYRNDECRYMFTKDQAARMRTALMNGTFRKDLNASPACKTCPDLIIIEPSVNLSLVTSGSTVTVSFAEDNKGNDSATGNLVGFYLSPDALLTPGLNGDIFLGEYFVSQSLPPLSQSLLLSQQLTIPSSILPDDYHLFLYADGSSVLNECIEQNNFASVVLSVSQPLSTGQPSFIYWFDNRFSNALAINTSSSTAHSLDRLVSTASLPTGLHTFNFCFKDGNDLLSNISSSFFYKLNTSWPAGAPKYQYWFDNFYSNRIVRIISAKENLLVFDGLDADELSLGLHVLNIHFKLDGKHWSSITSTFFYKMEAGILAGEAQYEYWFDNSYLTKKQINLTATNNLIVLENLNTDSLADGLHNLNMRFKPDGKHWSSVVSNFFYKIRNGENASITKYQYWFDNKAADSKTASTQPTNNLVLLNSIETTSLQNGLHTIHFRYYQDNGLWSSITNDFLYKSEPTNPNTLSKYTYWFNDDRQNVKTIWLTGLQNAILDINTDVENLSVGRHKISMIVKDQNGRLSSIVSDSFSKSPIGGNLCPNSIRTFVSGISLGTSATYQWQLDTGNGFSDIADNAFYTGTSADTLTLNNPPTSWYGYKYRCIVKSGNILNAGNIYTLRFSLAWNGNISNDWANPANWNCNCIPDGNTDVFINSGMQNYPEVNINGSCRSLTVQSGVSVTIKTGKTLSITH